MKLEEMSILDRYGRCRRRRSQAIAMGFAVLRIEGPIRFYQLDYFGDLLNPKWNLTSGISKRGSGAGLDISVSSIGRIVTSLLMM